MRKIETSVTLHLLYILQVGPTVFAADEWVDYSNPELEKDAIMLGNIEVIGVTPISGTGLPPEKIPANVFLKITNLLTILLPSGLESVFRCSNIRASNTGFLRLHDQTTLSIEFGGDPITVSSSI